MRSLLDRARHAGVEDWLDDHHEALQVALERLEVSIGRFLDLIEVSIGRFLDLIEDRMATKVKKLQTQAQETREVLTGW